MNFTDVDMKKEYEWYCKNVPKKRLKLSNRKISYRYFKNPDAKFTVVMLPGGTGLADAFFPLMREFTGKYSLLLFNYPTDFRDNTATADAIAQLIKFLKAENVYFWGQSYGGVLAQIIAKRHPEVTTGLILTSTASMSNNISYEGMACLYRMFNEEKEQKNERLYRMLPIKAIKPLMNLAFKKHLRGDEKAQKAVKDLLDIVMPQLTKDYFRHMNTLLCDLRNHVGTHHKEDFEYLRGKVLIIEPNDDKTFTLDIKHALCEIMTEPTVISEVNGGHLAMLFDTDSYMKLIDDFLSGQIS